MTQLATADLGALVLAIGRGDSRAELDLYRALEPAVRFFALRRVRTADADDFVQEALVAVIIAARERRIELPARVGSFALAVCRNSITEGFRTSARRQQLLDQFGGVLEPEAHTGTPAEWQLEDCLSRLDARARDVLRLTYGSGWGAPEIAKDLGIQETHVRVVRHRALKALLVCLEPGPEATP